MNSLQFPLLLFMFFSMLNAFSQDYESDEIPLASDEEMMVFDEAQVYKENSKEADMERQENIAFPNGEREWVLENENLPEEDF